MEFTVILVTLVIEALFIMSALSSIKKPSYGETKILNNPQLG